MNSYIKRWSRKGSRVLNAFGGAVFALTACTASAGDQWELTDFQKRIPGPQRLEMVVSDYSGTVHTDLAYIADRQAIVNHVSAYSYLIDEGRWDEWFSLFSEDVVFESTVPCFGTIRAVGKPAFKAFTDMRYRGPGSEKNTTVRRHTMGNIHVAKQSKDSAEVRSYMLISAAPADGKLIPITTGTYNATLAKRDGRWTITRWYVEVDVGVKQSAIPEGFSEDTMTLIPDDREVCLKK